MVQTAKVHHQNMIWWFTWKCLHVWPTMVSSGSNNARHRDVRETASDSALHKPRALPLVLLMALKLKAVGQLWNLRIGSPHMAENTHTRFRTICSSTLCCCSPVLSLATTCAGGLGPGPAPGPLICRLRPFQKRKITSSRHIWDCVRLPALALLLRAFV